MIDEANEVTIKDDKRWKDLSFAHRTIKNTETAVKHDITAQMKSEVEKY